MKDPIVPIFLSLEEKLNLKRAGFPDSGTADQENGL